MKINFTRIDEMIAISDSLQKPLSSVILEFEAQRSERPQNEIWTDMKASLKVMRTAINEGLAQTDKSFSGLVGGDANRLINKINNSPGLTGSISAHAAAYALSVSEVNASMGKVVACPTAGSCGILPGALLAAGEALDADDDDLVRALFTAAGIGMVIAENASIAGAIGGCQAECGSAAAMAAGAITDMAGGTPQQVSHALALALKNLLGLVCDPVAGLVEVPCVKRNAFGAVHALLAAEMALAGIESVIPSDEVISTMHQIGLSMPRALKETSEGGLAKTPTAISITARLQAGKPANL
ncbi:L-serine dehydratase, alpha chain [bioreactor metagenome]|uniref:L-serine dehydratase, alpha chain n=1 Tax=bioreactor metagenome TaxID=1076179 RepID=A0A644TM98_9ZZZZ|nr:L-serine ammonia-lyase, iron-sulfur-dependent, subunit alpha [Negativicutes bacterium]